MKEVMSIVRFNKMNVTKRALVDAGFYAMTTLKVMGRGKANVDYMLAEGVKSGVEEAENENAPSLKFVPKRLVTIVVPDDKVRDVIDTIMEVNQTGNHGDGKIFVLPVSGAVRISTEETGDAAIDNSVTNK
jgi:nitrogen regulatory protein PII 2